LAVAIDIGNIAYFLLRSFSSWKT